MTFFLKSFKNKKGFRRYIGPKRLVLLTLFIVFIIFIWDYYKNSMLSLEIIEQYRSQFPISTIIVFILLYAIFVIVALPTLPLNLAAGYFWGGLSGGIYTALSVTLGGWISFLIARYLIGQPLTEQFENKWINIIQEEFAHNGWKFVAFARINPIIPTGPLNYLLGLTSLSNRGFLMPTFIFLLPPSIAVAYMGDVLQTFTAQQLEVSEFIRGILIVSAIVTLLTLIQYATTIYKKDWRKNESNSFGNDIKRN